MSISLNENSIINQSGSAADGSRLTKVSFLGYTNADVDANEVYSGVKTVSFSGVGIDGLNVGGIYENTLSTRIFYVEIDGENPDTFKWSYNSDLSNPEEENVPVSVDSHLLSDGISVNFTGGSGSGYILQDKWTITISLDLSLAHELARLSASHDGTQDDTNSKVSLSINNDTFFTPTITQTSGSGLFDLSASGYPKKLELTNYYVRIVSDSNPNTFEWSKDNFATIEETGIQITGSAQTLENDVSITFNAVTGHTLNDEFTITYQPDERIVMYSNGFSYISGTVINNGVKLGLAIYDAAGNLLNGE